MPVKSHGKYETNDTHSVCLLTSKRQGKYETHDRSFDLKRHGLMTGKMYFHVSFYCKKTGKGCVFWDRVKVSKSSTIGKFLNLWKHLDNGLILRSLSTILYFSYCVLWLGNETLCSESFDCKKTGKGETHDALFSVSYDYKKTGKWWDSWQFIVCLLTAKRWDSWRLFSVSFDYKTTGKWWDSWQFM